MTFYISQTTEEEEEEEEDEMKVPSMDRLTRQKTNLNIRTREHTPNDMLEEDEQQITAGTPSMRCDFWDRHFEGQSEVTWNDFREHFLNDYGDRIVRHFSEEQKKWFVNLIYKDIFELRKSINKTVYDHFTGKNAKADHDHFYNRLRDYAIGYFAMREVFDMESSVRITAIRNLGKY